MSLLWNDDLSFYIQESAFVKRPVLLFTEE